MEQGSGQNITPALDNPRPTDGTKCCVLLGVLSTLLTVGHSPSVQGGAQGTLVYFHQSNAAFSGSHRFSWRGSRPRCPAWKPCVKAGSREPRALPRWPWASLVRRPEAASWFQRTNGQGPILPQIIWFMKVENEPDGF